MMLDFTHMAFLVVEKNEVAQWDQIPKKMPFKKSVRHLKNCKNMNFCTFKTTKLNVFTPKCLNLKSWSRKIPKIYIFAKLKKSKK